MVILSPTHMSAAMTFLGWYQFKLFIEHASGISLDALHIIIGFAIFLFAAHVFKRSVAHSPGVPRCCSKSGMRAMTC